MPPFGSLPTIDPFASFTAGAFVAGTERPLPLVSTSFDVAIDGGLARVATRRVFRNDEAQSIEATITFPLPVHAVLFALEAEIAGRALVARARRREEARGAYEDALERGKAAVLHEEVLRGVHMLSVGQLGAGEEIAVTARWVASLTCADGLGRLRIPLTVGDIYGNSGLADADELIHGGKLLTAGLRVASSDGAVELAGTRLHDGQATVPLNRPIDLTVTLATLLPCAARAADGRRVAVRVSPAPVSSAPLDLAVLVDHSGSMAGTHDSVRSGLAALATEFGAADSLDLWEFDDQLGHIGLAGNRAGVPGPSTRAQWLERVARLSPPRGGTEIGGALAGVIERSPARDILVVTDGKSYALDVHKLAQAGRRISVVLIGEDSLEANIGHLAALSGGDIFSASDAGVAATLRAALASLRAPATRPERMTGRPEHLSVIRSGAVLEAEWSPADEPTAGAAEGVFATDRAVAAFAASLALPALDEAAAAQLAETEGLVTHLTSLVLVDEAGAVQPGIPATRKIALPSPAMSATVCASMVDRNAWDSGARLALRKGGDIVGFFKRIAPPDLVDLGAIGSAIDWDRAPNELLAGDLSGLDPDTAEEIERAALTGPIHDAASRAGLAPVALVLGLIARGQPSSNRTAARIAAAILAPLKESEIDDLLAELVLV